MPEGHMTLQVRTVNEVTVLDLDGRLIMGQPVDLLTAQVRDVLASGHRNLAINLAGLTYVDSSGIAAMVGAYKEAEKAATHCKFFAASKRVLQLLRIARLETTFLVHADEDSVISSF
jgi:anti-sigma B factor antagonist